MSTIEQQDQDYAWFLKNYESLYNEYGKSYLAIKGNTVLGAYPSYAEAVHATEQTESLGSFIVQYCNGDESGYTNHIASMFVMGR